MSVKIEWNEQQFMDRMKEILAENAAVVGKFCEEDARKRLLAIKDPERGSKYRQNYIARELTHTVEVLPKEVVVTVGLPPGKRRQSGGFTQHVGFYIEMGSRTWGQNPYIRPAVFQNKKQIVDMLLGRS